MRKKFYLLLPILAGLVIAAANIPNNQASDALLIIDENYFDDQYEINDTLNFPSATEAYFKKSDGEISKATYGEVSFPNGEVRAPGNYILNIAGEYTVKYLDSVGGSFEHDFVVKKNVYELGDGVKATYCDSMPKSGKPGLALTLVSGGAFRLNKIVNLNDFSEGDVNVYNLYPLFRESVDDLPAACYCSIKLLDAYDESRFIEFYLWCGSTEPAPYYVGAGASTQNLTGLENNPNKPERNNVVYEGVAMYKHTVTRYQTTGAYGQWEDYKTNAEVIKDGGARARFSMKTGKYTVHDGRFVTDLDSKEIYSNNTIDLDTFFTTGEVIPQIECFGFNTASMNVEVASILGMSGKDLKNAIVEDDEAPVFRNEISSSPVYISRNKKFFIPTNLLVTDINYFGDLKSSVYYNYGGADQVLVESSDHFIPTNLGKYTVVYTATDSFKNSSTYCLTLNCIEKAPFVYEEKKLSNIEGAKLNFIPELDIKSNNEGLSVHVYAIDPKGNKEELILDNKGYQLVPFYIGDYEIIYDIKDKFYSETLSYKVPCLDKGNIYFDSMPPLYPYYIKDAEYSLTDFTGLKASNEGAVKVSTDAYISFDGSSFSKIANTRKFAITGNNNVKFKFVNGSYSNETEEIGIVDIAFGQKTLARNYSKYFQGSYASATDTTKKGEDGKYPSEMRYKFSSGGSMEYVNLISASNFSFDFVINLKTYDTLAVELQDYVDVNNYIKVEINKISSSNIVFTITQYDQEEILSFNATYYSDSSNDEFSIVLRDNKFFLIGPKGNIISNDMACRFELTKLSVTNSNAIDIVVKSINNVSFAGSNAVFEGVPQAYIYKSDEGIELGKTYTISPCIASSVLSPVLADDILMDVFLPDGNYAKDVNGRELKSVSGEESCNILLDKCGQYKIAFSVSAVGSNGKGKVILNSKDGTQETAYVLNIDDTIAPTISFTDSSDLSIQVGDRIKIRDYNVSDNITSKENMVVKIMVTDARFAVLENGYNVKEYTFRKKGTYYVVAYAIDEAGNHARCSYKVLVGAN